jgi:hypothetical protein
MEAQGEERIYNSCSFSTSALDADEWSASRPGRALPPGNGIPVPNVQETGWAPEPVRTQKTFRYPSTNIIYIERIDNLF